MLNMAASISIVALRNEKGSYNFNTGTDSTRLIVALRNEKGSYNGVSCLLCRI